MHRSFPILRLALCVAFAACGAACDDDGGGDGDATMTTGSDATTSTADVSTSGDATATTSADAAGEDTEEIFVIGGDMTTDPSDTTTTTDPGDTGGGDTSVDTPAEREARFRAGIDVIEAAQTDFCACASNPNSGWCNDLPDECFDSAPACMAEVHPFGDETIAQCAIDALNMYPAEADALLDCQEQPTLTYRDCMAGVSALCSTFEIVGCGEPFVTALQNCRQAPDLDAAMDACSQ